jgi:uncharacterized protein (TIGR03437 family)
VSVNPANLGLGTYNGTIIVSGANGVAGTVTLNVSLTVTGPLPTINPGGLVNAASNSSGPVAPGSIAAVMGSFPLASSSTAPSGPPWPTNLGGLSIQFDGIPAPIYYASASQVNLQVPWELTGSTQVPVTATVGTQTSSPQTTNLAPFSPGLFSMNAQGSGQGAILNLQYLLVDSSNPASVGDVIQIYCTGLGAVTNQPASGALAPVSPLAQTTTPPVVTIGGTSAKVLYSGLAPGAIGLYQLDAQIPTGILTGPAVPVMVSLGGMTSNTVTLPIQPFPNPQPAITGLSPSSATAGTGPLTLTISGSGFIASSTVTYNSSPHPLSSVGSNQLTITLSTADLAAVGTFPVIVSNPASGGGNSNPVNFTVSPPANPQPLITSLTPSSATAGTNSLMLAINGSGFIVSSTVTFNGVSHSPSLVNSGQLTITLTGSDLAAAGSFPVFVTNPPPGGGVSNSMTFSVLPPATNGLTGNWTGTWGSIPTGVVGTVSAKLVQTGTALTGSISLNSTCFPGGPLSGTVIGSAINATITISGIQLASLDGTVTTSNSIEGAYLVSYSLCTDYGFYFLNRAQ